MNLLQFNGTIKEIPTSWYFGALTPGIIIFPFCSVKNPGSSYISHRCTLTPKEPVSRWRDRFQRAYPFRTDFHHELKAFLMHRNTCLSR